MKIGLIIGVLLLSSLCMAQSVSTNGESLDKVQVLALLAGEVSNSRVANLVVERGITFEPTNRYIQLLQKAGANEGVITAVRIAQRPPAAPKAAGASPRNAPLERDQILDLLQTSVDSDLLAKLVATRGIDFEPFDEYLHAYEIAGAQESLLSALRQAGGLKSGAAAATRVPPKGAGEKPAATGTNPKRIRVAGETEAARITFQPKPDYPPLARNARIQGTVRLDAIIGQDGAIEELKVLSGPALLIKPTMDVVSKWRYQPALVKGKPVEVETEIDVDYVLQL
ncbi:MAG: energy transducer TonB [Terriglobia bacterium]|jgi:TonB family protein